MTCACFSRFLDLLKFKMHLYQLSYNTLQKAPLNHLNCNLSLSGGVLPLHLDLTFDLKLLKTLCLLVSSAENLCNQF